MKILMINVVCGIRSTGRICTDLAEMLEQKGHKVKIAYGRESVPQNVLGSLLAPVILRAGILHALADADKLSLCTLVCHNIHFTGDGLSGIGRFHFVFSHS